MCKDLEESRYGEHASNLGPILAQRLGEMLGVPAYIVDPITVDEYEPSSRISGVPGIERKCRTHSLNIKSVARRCAREMGKAIERHHIRSSPSRGWHLGMRAVGWKDH